MLNSYISNGPIESGNAYSETLSREAPRCRVMLSRPSEPTCILNNFKYDGWYWPPFVPTGAAFCANRTTSAPTPTWGDAQTAVVSGLTLTSPSIYHFLSSLEIRTIVGYPSEVGSRGTSTSWSTTTVAVSAPPLSVAVLEKDALRQWVTWGGSPIVPRQIYKYATDFDLTDWKTLRAEKATPYGAVWMGTIIQNDYVPTLGVRLTDVAAQNTQSEASLLTACKWTTGFNPIQYTEGPIAVAVAIQTSNFHAIQTRNGEAVMTKV